MTRNGKLRLLAVVALLAAAVAGCGAPSLSGSPGQSLGAVATFAPGVPTSVLDLESGDCFNGSGDATAREVAVTDCDEEHEYEVFAVAEFDAAQSEPYPGAEALKAFVNEQCTEQFARFVGTQYDDSDLWLSGVVPTENSWASGDREVRCALYLPDLNGAHLPLTGSAEGSNR